MATKVTVNGRQFARPDVYSLIKSGITNPPLNLSYGNVCLIDTGLGATYGGGSGIVGTNNSGSNSVYRFNNLDDFRLFMKGGEIWNIAEPLFRPFPDVNGISNLFYIRAATTVRATKVLTFTNGSLSFATKDEGLIANGTLTSGELTKGYAIKLLASPRVSGKYIMRFYIGTFKGLDALNANAPYDNIAQADSKPLTILETPDVSTLAELVTFFNTNQLFNELFYLTASTITTTGEIVAGDLVTITGYQLFAGGTETYGDADLTAAIAIARTLDNTFFLADQFGTTAQSADNTAIFGLLTGGQLRYEKYMVVGGGYDSSAFTGTNSSIATANYYNSPKVITVHAGAKKSDITKISGFRNVSQLWKAAAVLGRIAGLEPQTPITFKSININAEIHELTDDEKETAIAEGVLYTNYDIELDKFVVGAGINTMQVNDYLVDSNGNSYSISVERIKSQLNKEIIFNAKRRFFGGEAGPNRNTISEEELRAWLKGFLQSKIATTSQDNLILRFGTITVTRNQDIYNVTYEFVPNGEINKIVFVGLMLDN